MGKETVKILVLTDDEGYLTESLKSSSLTNTVDVKYIVEQLRNKYAYKVECLRMVELDDFEMYRGWYVLYASSEDAGLFCKDYIEDVLMRLIVAGAILIPGIDFFRAHHNKSYMELYKSSFYPSNLPDIKSKAYAGLESLKVEINSVKYPVVIKASSGAGSEGVALVNNEKELLTKARKLSARKYGDYYYSLFRTFPFVLKLKNIYRRIRGQRQVYYKPMQGKFVLQEYIPDLVCDYKVLVFGKKYYALQRLCRSNDFRASGSGKFSFVSNPVEITAVLDYAQEIFESMCVPFASLDIADNGENCFLIEYQAVNFGPYTLEFSQGYFTKGDAWQFQSAESIFEEEYSRAIFDFINAFKY